MKLAERMNRIGVETAFEVLVRARALEAQGRDIIHLEIGEPDFDTPRHIVEAGKQALDQGWTHYGPTQGQPELREAIASYICRTRGEFAWAAEHVCVVPGGKPIIFFPMLALLEPGDEVIYPNPGFPIYESMINFLGAKPVPIPLVEDRGFSFDLNVLKDTPVAEDQDADSEFAAQSDRRRDSRRRHPRHRGHGARSRSDGAVRRDLLAHLLRRSRRSPSRTLPGHAGEDHHPGWILEDLRHDRLAHGLRRDAARGWSMR